MWPRHVQASRRRAERRHRRIRRGLLALQRREVRRPAPSQADSVDRRGEGGPDLGPVSGYEPLTTRGDGMRAGSAVGWRPGASRRTAVVKSPRRPYAWCSMPPRPIDVHRAATRPGGVPEPDL